MNVFAKNVGILAHILCFWNVLFTIAICVNMQLQQRGLLHFADQRGPIKRCASGIEVWLSICFLCIIFESA